MRKSSLRRGPYLSTLFVAASLLFSAGCREETIIKSNLAPSSVHQVELDDNDFVLHSRTVWVDTVLTSRAAFGESSGPIVHTAGALNDPYFGFSSGWIYLQILPEKPQFLFSADPFVIDSAVLLLPYAGFSWGDTSAQAPHQTYQVYRVTEDMKVEELLYSFSRKSLSPDPVGQATTVDLYALRKDSINILGENKPPHLRIPLRPDFVEELRQAAAQSGDNAQFLSQIKGLAVGVTDSNQGRTLPYFLLNGGQDYLRAAVQFFFRENGGSDTRVAFFHFVPSDCAHFNEIRRRYQGTPSESFLNSTAPSDTVVLIQNPPGAALDLQISGFSALEPGIVHKAQLNITQVVLPGDPDYTTFSPPARIFPVRVDDQGKSSPVLDVFPQSTDEGANFVNGIAEIINFGGIQLVTYTINFPRETQRLIAEGQDRLRLRINGSPTYYGAFRMTAGGAGHSHPQAKIRFHLSYSKLP